MSFAFENLGLTTEELDQYLASLAEEARRESDFIADSIEALKVSEKDRTNDVDDELAAIAEVSLEEHSDRVGLAAEFDEA